MSFVKWIFLFIDALYRSLCITFINCCVATGSAKNAEISSHFQNPTAATWDRCYDFLNIFADIYGEKISVFDSKQS
jgi:hypothetical protein